MLQFSCLSETPAFHCLSHCLTTLLLMSRGVRTTGTCLALSPAIPYDSARYQTPLDDFPINLVSSKSWEAHTHTYNMKNGEVFLLFLSTRLHATHGSSYSLRPHALPVVEAPSFENLPRVCVGLRLIRYIYTPLVVVVYAYPDKSFCKTSDVACPPIGAQLVV